MSRQARQEVLEEEVFLEVWSGAGCVYVDHSVRFAQKLKGD
jgi:hypothetical protein